tara:strand:- start:248 stop:502 length:255 start_codon:yes stop_codon:yes gene_type:complete
MKPIRFRKMLLSLSAIALLAANAILLLPQEVKAQELFGARADCYWNWRPNGPGVLTSFIKCDDCTRIEAYVPADDRRCRFATPE